MTGTGFARQLPIDAVMESNHRIGNHLDTIMAVARQEAAKLEAGPAVVRRDDAVAILRGVGGKVAALARLHRALAADAQRGCVDLAHVLGDTLHPLKELYGARLRLEMNLAAGCSVTGAQASVLALAFAEIVSNAMKHAHPSGLPVEMAVRGVATAGGGVALEISDDGVGLPEGFDPARDSGVGMKMIRYMVDSVGGEFRTMSDALGLTVAITLPQERQDPRPLP